MSKTYSGFNKDTAQNLLLDAGAFFKDFDPATDTFENAVKEGKLIGATRGGGEFKAEPEIRAIDVDGVKGKAKGLQVIDTWTTSIKANVLEVTPETIKMSLASGNITDGEKNTEVVANNYISIDDYIENITWVGKLSGSEDPVIIQIFNALSTSGLTLTTQDKNEAVIEMLFEGHYSPEELDTPPFKILFPKKKVK